MHLADMGCIELELRLII